MLYVSTNGRVDTSGGILKSITRSVCLATWDTSWVACYRLASNHVDMFELEDRDLSSGASLLPNLATVQAKAETKMACSEHDASLAYV
jgi:hypothetical protein